jgi:pimeloyl-ACP methyl ester carboxylesterase
MMLMKFLTAENLTFAIDTFGDPNAPPVLLIAGASQSMDWWEPEFCELLAAEGLSVIRFDQRDTGQSTMSPPRRPDYTGADLATDPLRILDALGLPSAHFVGLSMGSGIAQHLGVHAASRVRTLTLIESSPAGGDVGELPPPTPALTEAAARIPQISDWTDTEAVIRTRIAEGQAYSGSAGADERRLRTIASTEVGRTSSMESAMTNHFLAASGPAVDPREITAPTLVIHSETDPLFPPAHGEALARMIPGARLLRLESMGHETPPPETWSVVVPAIVDHIVGNDDGSPRPITP